MPLGTGYIRGRPVRWDAAARIWRWADDGTPAEGWGGDPRPCPCCRGLPEPGGVDPCLGRIAGLIGACCGHGVHRGYAQYSGTPYPPGYKRGAHVGRRV